MSLQRRNPPVWTGPDWTTIMTTTDIAGLCERLRRKAGFNDPVTGEYMNFPINSDGHQAADTIERQAAEIERLRRALRNIQIEAEREEGRWVHLKRVIAINARAALTGEDAGGKG